MNSRGQFEPGRKAVAGIVLAAGESRRMGSDKALLPLGRQTFLEHLLEVLRWDVPVRVVVLGHHAAEIEARLPRTSDLAVLHNPQYPLGQLSSLQVALRHLEKQPVEGVLVCLVDHPAINRSVVRMILEKFRSTGAPVVIPAHRGRRGHPVLFARSVFGELLEAPLEEGARRVVHNHASEIELVEVAWEGILWDIDQPADYQRLLEEWKRLTAGGKAPC
ncbi:MAG: nucleotidyltransferase family protein [Acidobacteria bacterium]|nr:nucleotidyltransferase family protein [Acidobacteriota bacterium]